MLHIAVNSLDEPIESVNYGRRLSWSSSEEASDLNGNDYLSFYIYRSPLCYYVPAGIADNFKNIKVLVIAYTGLKVIRQKDLKPLKNLQNLYLDNNQLTFLEKDLFAFNTDIIDINLANNQISFVAPNVFEPLTKLNGFNFSENVCFKRKPNSGETALELKTAVAEHCSKVEENIP